MIYISELYNIKEVTEQEAKGEIEVKKEVDKWTIGGYVRLLVNYGIDNQHKKGTIAQISNLRVGNAVYVNLNYYTDLKINEDCILRKDTECEWIGMEKPLEESERCIHIHNPKTGLCACGHSAIQEEWTPKIGDWVLLSNNAYGWGACKEDSNNLIVFINKIDYDDVSEEKGRIYFKNKKGITVTTVGKEVVRKALPHEIPPVTFDELKEEIIQFAEREYGYNRNDLLPKPQETPVFISTRKSTNQLLKTKLN